VLNVNFPKLKEKDIKGIKICRQAKALWMEKFDKRKTPQGKDYYWLTGEFINQDNGQDTDEWALENGYVSIVPIHFDMTAHHTIQQLNTWNLNEKSDLALGALIGFIASIIGSFIFIKVFTGYSYIDGIETMKAEGKLGK